MDTLQEKYIAIIAHDGKKATISAFLTEHQTLLENTILVATDTTGKYVKQAGLEMKSKLSVIIKKKPLKGGGRYCVSFEALLINSVTLY